ncbi:MAG: hypothetical protein V7637_6282 [Mycobacteriales bacterium]
MAGPRARQVFAAVTKLSLAILVSGLLVAGLTLPAVGGLGIATRNSLQSFEDQPCDIHDLTNPPQKSVIYAADGSTIASLFSYNREIVPIKGIPEVMKKAVVAIEDRRFYKHHGVDTQGLFRALVRNSSAGGTVQGGSTLTQQLVKQIKLYEAKTPAEQQAAIEQTPARKLLEAKCALTLEKKYSKDEILWRYLNIANFGAGAYGVGTAARTYFGRPLSQITLDQAAMLAGMVQSPTRYNPYENPKVATARRNTVLDEMRSVGYITQKQATDAKNKVLRVAPKQPSARDCGNANRAIPNVGFFCDYLKSYLAKIGFPQSRLETGGYKIYTTLDPKLQTSAQAAAYDKVPPDKRAAAVMDLLDPTTGEIKAMAVSKLYSNTPKGYERTTLPLPTLAAAGAGSTFKLFTTIAALSMKIPLRDFKMTVDDTYDVSDNCKTPGRIDKPVHNAGHYGPGPWDIEHALFQSDNTFFVALIDQQMNCDPTLPADYAVRLGLSLKTQKEVNSKKSVYDAVTSEKQYSFTLGPNGTNPLELAAAYGTVANQGKYCPPTPVKKIVDASGKPVSLPERPCTQVLDPGIANTVTHVLEKDTMPGFPGTANSKFSSYYSQGGDPVGGKTGTASASVTNDQGRDDTGKNSAAWFVGVTPHWAGSVAVFNPDNPATALYDVPGFNNGGRDIFGAFGAGIWIEALGPTLLNSPAWQFPPEDPQVVNGNSIPVPPVTGMDIDTATKTLEAAGFGIQVAADRKDAALPADRIAEQSPNSRGIPGQRIVVYLSSGHPPAGQGCPAGQASPQPGKPCQPIQPGGPGQPGNNGGGNNGGGRGGGGGGGGG